MNKWLAVSTFIFFSLGFASIVSAQKVPAPYVFDATAPTHVPETGFLHMGGVSPSGHRLEVNSSYLTLDGKPWLPVMGEFHFSRYPEKYWQEELLKMKAGGVSVVSTYVFWIHHEEIEGQFDWTGQRNLRHFVELCRQDGLYVYLRVGPWAHGEVRNGGFPDWLVNKKIPLRRNNPEYLKYVTRYFGEIGSQIHGQLWQDGGPIIGVQLENEYGKTGPGAGAAHLMELKRLAIAAGINPPLFSITRWPPIDFPAHEFIPFNGGYPEKYWLNETADLPPSSLYLFTLDRAISPDASAAVAMGAMTPGDPSSKVDYRHYPLFSAEMAGGMETSYQRRPLMQPDDIAALTLTRLGSGMNLYGYYMFQGGAQPAGKLAPLQESIASGYPNDLPRVSYDYQAPLGQYGQERESFRKLKNMHLFLKSFGSDLAMMSPYLPDRTPKDAADVNTVRVALRAYGNRGFLFVNNYVRKLAMPEHRGFQIRVKLPSGSVDLPRNPIDVPANSYFIWPLNLDLGAGTLQYSTAQLLSRLDKNGESTYFFFAIPGLRTEFSFDAASVASVTATSGSVTRSDGIILVQNPEPGKNTLLHVAGKNGRNVRILLLSEAQAEQFWRVRLGDQDVAMLSPADVFAGADGVHLCSVDPSRITASIYSPGGIDHSSTFWQERSWKIEPRKIDFEWTSTRDAAARSSVHMQRGRGRHSAMPLAPEDADFAGAAAWSLSIPAQSMQGLSNIYLNIRYTGDVARLSENGRLLDDDFYNGRTWEIGLKRFLPEAFGKKLEVDVLPMPRKAPIYLDARAWEQMNASGQTAKVTSVELLPEYEVVIAPSHP